MLTIIEKILTGDESAVINFYNEYSPKILSYIKRKVAKDEDAQELLQDIFLQALDSLALYEGRCSISTWLYTIAHHKVVDFYRKRKIKSVLLSQMPFLQLFAQEVNEPEFQFEKNKMRDRIETTLHKLSSRYRQILKMHYEDQIPVKKIALELDMSFKATESLLFRARQDFIRKYAKS